MHFVSVATLNVAWIFPLVVVLSALARGMGAVFRALPSFVRPSSPLRFFADFFEDERVVVEQARLRAEAQKAEEAMARKAEEVAALAARATRLRKQLDFLDHREEMTLRSEIECLELLEQSGVWLPEPGPESVGSLFSFSDVMGTLDWSSLEPLDAADGRS